MLPYLDKTPQIDDRCYITDGAQIIGDVTLAKNVSVWYNAVLRGDTDKITIGENSNVQDNATLHCTAGKPVNIGKNVTIGHNAVVHGATVKDNVLIGMGAIILDGAVIGENSIIGAGTIVTEGTTIPANSLVVGIPGKVVKTIDLERSKAITASAERYVKLAQTYLDAEK